MTKNYFETLVGFLVVIVTLIFFLYVRNVTDVTADSKKFYNLNAKFLRIDGIDIGSDVRIAGIKIGTVTDLTLNAETYEANMDIAISQDIKIPDDSYIAVISSGLIGKKYIDIEPGISEEYLVENDNIIFTRSSVSIENLISKFLFKQEK